jgi:hypothetical protein
VRLMQFVGGAALMIGLLGPSVACAQDDGDTEPPRGRRGGGGGPGMGADWTNQAVEMLTDELDLDEVQVEAVREILNGSMSEAFRRMADAWDPETGRPDPDRMRTMMEDVRLDVSRRINEVLTPAQQREFEVLAEGFDQRSQQWEQSRRVREDISQMFEPAPISRRLTLAKAERSLFLGPAETAAIMPYVERVIDLRIGLREGRVVRRQDLRNAVEGGGSPEEIVDRLEDLRLRHARERAELAAAEQLLREFLTIEQEVRFVAMGILD